MSYSYSPHKRRFSGPPPPLPPSHSGGNNNSSSMPGVGGGGSSYRGRPPPPLDYPRDYPPRYNRSPPRTSSSYRPNYNARPLTPTHSARSLSPTPSIQSGSNTPASANGFPPSSSGKAVYTRYRDRERDRDRDRDHYTYHHHPYDPPHASGSSYRRYERPPPPLPLPPSSSSRHPYPPPSRADYRESHHRHSSYGGPASAGLPPVGGGRAATAEAPPPPPLSARIHQAGTLPSATSTVSSTSTSSAVGSTSSSSIGSYARPALLPPQASGGLEYGDAEEDEEEEKRPAPEPAVEVKPGSAAVKSEPGGPAARERPESNPSQCQNQADDTPVSESENQQLPLPDGKLASAPDEHGERTEASPSLAPEQPTEPAAASDQAKSETSAVQEDQMQKAEQTKSSDAASSTAVDAATTPASLPQKSATDVGDMDLDSASLQRHSPQNLPEPASSAAQPKPDQTAAAPQEESTHHAEENQIPNLAPSAVANITNQTVIKDKSQEDTLRPQESPTRDTDMELDSATLQSRFEQNATEPARIESFQAIPPTEPQPDLTEGPSEPATLPIAHPGAEESPAQQQEDVLIASLDAGVAVSSETDVAAATAEPKPGDAQDENEKTAQGPTQTKENAEQPTAVAVAMDVDQVDAPEKVTAPAPINLPTQEEPMQHLSASLEQQPHEMASPETKLEADQTSISMAPDVEMQGPSKAAPASAVAAEEPKKAEEAKTASPPPKNFDELLHRSAQTSIAREEAFIEAFMRTVPSQPPQASSARLPSGRPRLSELTNGSTPHATAYYLPDVYQYNHNILRSRLEADFNQANQYRQSKIHALQERYLELHWTWKVLCERRERDKYQHDNRPLPAGSTYTLEQLGWAPHAAGGNNFQFGAGGPTSQLMSNMPPQSPGQPTTPLASGSHAHMSGAPSGRSSRRSGGGGAAFGHPFGDAVRSEAEFHEILKTLEDVDFLDPKSRAAKSAAVVPDMLLLDDPRRAVAAFEDDNARVEHPEAFYGIGQANVSRSDPAATEWTDEEVQTFLRRFAQFPKQFGKIAQELPDKNVSQCVLFYYRSKRTIDFRSLVERKYAGGRRGKRSRLLENSSGSSSLFTEVQERSKGKGKKTAPPMLGAEELGLSPPSTPQVGPPNHPTTYINKQMLNEPLTKSGLGAQVTHSILHGTSRRTEVEAARAKRRLTAAEAKQNQQQQQQQQEETSAAAAAAAAAATSTATAATPGGGPPSESQLEAAEALASLFAKPAPQANGDVDMADTTPTTTTTANSLQSSQQGAPPRTKRKLNPTSYWSTAEKSDFVKWLGVYGKDFPSIAQHIQNKSATQCRNYWANHHVKLNLDAIAAKATGQADPPSFGSEASLAETPTVESPAMVSEQPSPSLAPGAEAPAPQRPSIANQGPRRSNTSMQLRDLLNATEEAATGDQGPNSATSDWFGQAEEEAQKHAADEMQTEEGSEEGEMTPSSAISSRPPPTALAPPPHEYYRAQIRQSPYAERDSYFPRMPVSHSDRVYPPPPPAVSSSYARPSPTAYYSREALPPPPPSSYRDEFEQRRSSVEYSMSPVEGYARRPPMPPYDYAGSYRYPQGGSSRYERPL